mgnify:FL=1
MKIQYYINSALLRDLCIENNYCDCMDDYDWDRMLDNVVISNFKCMKIHIWWIAEQILTESVKFHNVSLKDVIEVRSELFEQVFNNCLRVKVNI